MIIKKWQFWLVVVLAVLTTLIIIFNFQEKTPDDLAQMTSEDILKYTTKDDPDAVITVGILKDGEMSWKVYGENGKELSKELHTYEM